jgi:C_GCAxxG_C_C family probable redox protein
MNDTESIANVATEKFSQGYNCAQSVLFAFSPKLGLDPNLALKLATGFGAGMGRRQEVCGAVSGGVMALSFKHGRADGDSKDKAEATQKLTRQLLEAFEVKHGTYLCKNLLQGCDLKTSEGQCQFKDRQLLDRVCKPCVRTVIELVNPQLA